MVTGTTKWAAVVMAAFVTTTAAAAPAWPPDELPMPLGVRTPQDLQFKSEAERLYLVFRLMVTGKIAYDAGDQATAARRWEELLRLPNVPPEVEKQVRALLGEARAGTGRPPLEAAASPAVTSAAGRTASSPAPVRVAVSGVVSGGGTVGPSGAVLWLKRTDGPTPTPRPQHRVMGQKNKTFTPRVLAVTVGSKIDFRNEDPYFHNVFSLSRTEKFDTGLYPAGQSYTQSFDKAGPVDLLCNIHASMMGFVYVLDTPYFAQPRGSGTFTIRNVPPGNYELHVWHEAALNEVKQPLRVGEDGVQGVNVKIPADRPPLLVVPDKYGKPRQPQLGY